MSDPEFQEAVDRLRQGDPAGMNALWDLLSPRLTQMASGVLGSRGEALDAVQDTFVSVWRSIGRYRDGTDFRAWITTICLNHCRMRLRSRGRERKALAGTARELPLWEGPAPHNDLLEAVRTELARMPEREREAFVLIAIQERRSDEAGKLMGISASAARVYLGRARKLLADRLGPLVKE